MHPALTEALLAERIREQRAQAHAAQRARLARQARSLRRSRRRSGQDCAAAA